MHRHNKKLMQAKNHKGYMKRAIYRNKGNIYEKSFRWKRPYVEPYVQGVDSIDTGLDGVFKYSPVF